MWKVGLIGDIKVGNHVPVHGKHYSLAWPTRKYLTTSTFPPSPITHMYGPYLTVYGGISPYLVRIKVLTKKC